MSGKIVLAVAKSTNSKTGLVSATYAPIQSCPETCPFIKGGCYAQHGHCGIHLRTINKAAREQNKTRPVDIARIEAQSIRELKSDLPLRLHIVGDCKTPKAAQIIADACHEYMDRTKQSVWTYTHAWKVIPREKWGKISVLASCESIEDAKYAMKRGYAASIVRAKPFSNIFDWEGIRMVPCLEMTKGITCDKCKLCMKDENLRNSNRVVCFFPHGTGAEIARRALFVNTPNKNNEHMSDKEIDDMCKDFDNKVAHEITLSDGMANRKRFIQESKDSGEMQ